MESNTRKKSKDALALWIRSGPLYTHRPKGKTARVFVQLPAGTWELIGIADLIERGLRDSRDEQARAAKMLFPDPKPLIAATVAK